jgi:hypothetical protein
MRPRKFHIWKYLNRIFSTVCTLTEHLLNSTVTHTRLCCILCHFCPGLSLGVSKAAKRGILANLVFNERFTFHSIRCLWRITKLSHPPTLGEGARQAKYKSDKPSILIGSNYSIAEQGQQWFGAVGDPTSHPLRYTSYPQELHFIRWRHMDNKKKLCCRHICTAKNQFRKFETNIPRKGTVRPQSQFHIHVYVSDLYTTTIDLPILL